MGRARVTVTPKATEIQTVGWCGVLQKGHPGNGSSKRGPLEMPRGLAGHPKERSWVSPKDDRFLEMAGCWVLWAPMLALLWKEPKLRGPGPGHLKGDYLLLELAPCCKMLWVPSGKTRRRSFRDPKRRAWEIQKSYSH